MKKSMDYLLEMLGKYVCSGLVTMALLAVPGLGFAEEPAGAEAPLLEPVKVTVPAQAERSKSVTLISREQMDGEWAMNMNDYLFSMRPGIGTARRSNVGFMGPGSGFFVRGLNRERVAVFVDGIPSQVNNHFHPLVDQYTPDLLQRIEITRGPSGVSHGASAAGGVIDIYTYKPPKGATGYGYVSTGSDDTRELQGRGAYGSERGTIQFSGTYRATDGHRPNSEFNATTLNAHGTLEITPEWELGFRAGRTDANIENPGTVSSPSLSKSTQDPRNAVVTLDRKTANSNSFAALYWNKSKVHAIRSGGGAPQNFTRFVEKEFGLRMKQQWLPKLRNTYTVGFDAVKYDDERSNGSNTQEDENNEAFVSPYAQLTYPLGDKTDIDGGMRATYSDQFGWDLSPELGLVYHADKSLALRSRVGKSYRVPRVNDTNAPFGVPNDNIYPERFWNVEVGLNKQLGKVGFVDASLFDIAVWYMKGDDLLQTVQTGPFTGRLENTGDFNNWGIETTLDISINRNLAFFLGGGWSNLDEDLRQVPEKTVDAGLTFKKNRFGANFMSRYAADNHDMSGGQRVSLGSYYVADVQLSYELIKGTNAVFNILNLTDENYETIAGFPQVDRTFYFAIRSYLN